MITGFVQNFKVNGDRIDGNVFANPAAAVQVSADGLITIPAAAAGGPASYDIKIVVRVTNTTTATNAGNCITTEAPATQNFAVLQQVRNVNAPTVTATVKGESFYIAVAELTAQGKDAQGNSIGDPVVLQSVNGCFQIGDPNDLFLFALAGCTAADTPVTTCIAPSPAQGATVTLAAGAKLDINGAYFYVIKGKTGTNKSIVLTWKIDVAGPNSTSFSFSAEDTFTAPASGIVNAPAQILNAPAGAYKATITVTSKVSGTPQTDPACRCNMLSRTASWTFTVDRNSSSSSSSGSSESSDSSGSSGSSPSSSSSEPSSSLSSSSQSSLSSASSVI